jgi:RNase P subunit RPR2
MKRETIQDYTSSARLNSDAKRLICRRNFRHSVQSMRHSGSVYGGRLLRKWRDGQCVGCVASLKYLIKLEIFLFEAWLIISCQILAIPPF